MAEFIAWVEGLEWWQIALLACAAWLLWEVFLGMIRGLSRAIQGKDD